MKSERTRLATLKAIERVEKFEAYLAQKGQPKPLMAPVRAVEPAVPTPTPTLGFHKRKRGDPFRCLCGVVIYRYAAFCAACRPSKRATTGVEFKAPIYAFKFKKTGKKCKNAKCETLTERYDGFCLHHTNPMSKSKKYKTNVPLERPHVLPSLADFKKHLS